MEKREYLKLVEKRKQEAESIEILMPSGATWLCKPINLRAYAAAGRLPMNLISALPSTRNKPIKQPTEAELREGGMKALLMVRDVMLSNLVSPRITLEETEDSITPDQIDPEDFDYFFNFVMNGAQVESKKNSSQS